MRVYLDSNVLINVCDGRAPELATLLLHAVDAGKYSFPLSAKHVDEITFDDNSERSHTRLQFLKRLSRDAYFFRYTRDWGFRAESPFSVFATLNELVVEPSLEQSFACLIPYEEQRQARAALGLSSIELNNLTPREAINRIDKALASYNCEAASDIAVPRSPLDFLFLGENLTKKHFAGVWTRLEADPDDVALDHRIASLFSLFDTFWFWPDDRIVYEKGTRFADSRHASNAAHFSMFISRDKRLLNKSAVVYEYLGLPVLAQTTAVFESLLRQDIF